MATPIERADAVVCIPWRAMRDRVPAFARVRRFWEEAGFTIITADSDPALPFNLSQARNNAVRQAGTDVVIVADADTIPDLKIIDRAIRATKHNHVIYPFDEYIYLGERPDVATVDVETAETERIYTASVGGIMVLRRALYWDLGGHDEGFHRWGYEDTAFQLVAETLAGIERFPGKVWAFGHHAERDMTHANPGRARIMLYRFARRDEKIMRELIRR